MLAGLRNIIGLLIKILFMFQLFKRTKIEEWEINLIKNTFEKIPQYTKFINQISSNLLEGVRIGNSDISNYIALKYNPAFYKQFEELNGRNFKLTGLKVFDIISNNYLPFSIYFTHGILIGYSIDSQNTKFKLDITKIDLSSVKKIFLNEINVSEIISKLSKEELELINKDDIFVSYVNENEFFHLKEIEDGDFIGMDNYNNLYKITHDPIAVIPIEREELLNFLK
jgi:hypothetical protein